MLLFICIGVNPSWSILNSRFVGDRMIITPKIFIVEFGKESGFLFHHVRVTIICHPSKASSSYRLHVHTFIMHAPKCKVGPLWVYDTQFWGKKTLEIKSVLAASSILKKSWSLWTKAWLTSSLLEQILKNISREIPSNWPIIFVQAPTKTQPEEIGGQHDQEPQHNLKGNCITVAEWSLLLFYQKKKPLVWSCQNFFWFCLNLFLFFVDNLTQNFITLFLSTEPFLLIRSCVFLCSSHAFIFVVVSCK